MDIHIPIFLRLTESDTRRVAVSDELFLGTPSIRRPCEHIKLRRICFWQLNFSLDLFYSDFLSVHHGK